MAASLAGAWRQPLARNAARHPPLRRAVACFCSSAESPTSAPRPPRFYIPARLADAAPGAVLRLPAEESRHAAKTLRLRQGDRIELCDGSGFVALAEMGGVDRAGAVAQVLDAAQLVPAVGWQWRVACACGSLKGGRSDWLVEKCAELGAAAFTPLLTHRSPTIGGGGGRDDGRPAGRGAKQAGRRRGGRGEAEEAEEGKGGAAGSGREGRWERVAIAAMKQSLRPHGMPISRPCSVQQLCERIRAADAALVGVAGAPPLPAVAARLQAGAAGQGTATPTGVLCIGPEGDWTAEELAQLTAAGAQPVGLGPLRLRAETAALALLSYVRLHLV